MLQGMSNGAALLLLLTASMTATVTSTVCAVSIFGASEHLQAVSQSSSSV